MKNFNAFFGLSALVLVYAGTAQARSSGDQGFGLLLGSPTGITVKAWFSDQIAMDGGLGAAQGDLAVHADFLYHDFQLLKNTLLKNSTADIDLPVYIGAGPRVLFHKKEEFGLRIPLGVSLLPRQTPWEFFVEVAPIIRFTPDTGGNFDFAIGARYYFEAIRPRQ